MRTPRATLPVGRAAGVSAAALASVLAACGASQKRDEAAKRYEMANYWYTHSKLVEAGQVYADAIQLKDGDYPEAEVGLANVRREQCRMELQHYIGGDAKKGIDRGRVQSLYEEAEYFFLRTLDRHPDFRDAYYGLGELYFDMAMSKALQSSPEKKREWLEHSRDRFEKAYALDMPPKSGAIQEYLAQLYHALGQDCIRRGDNGAALDAFKRARRACDLFVAWYPKQPVWIADPDGSEQRLKAFEQLRAALDEAIAAYPDQASAPSGPALKRKPP